MNSKNKSLIKLLIIGSVFENIYWSTVKHSSKKSFNIYNHDFKKIVEMEHKKQLFLDGIETNGDFFFKQKIWRTLRFLLLIYSNNKHAYVYYLLENEIRIKDIIGIISYTRRRIEQLRKEEDWLEFDSILLSTIKREDKQKEIIDWWYQWVLKYIHYTYNETTNPYKSLLIERVS